MKMKHVHFDAMPDPRFRSDPLDIPLRQKMACLPINEPGLPAATRQP